MFLLEISPFPLRGKARMGDISALTKTAPSIQRGCFLFIKTSYMGSWISAARRVLRMSMAIVIGPTPPGEGETAPATSATSS